MLSRFKFDDKNTGSNGDVCRFQPAHESGSGNKHNGPAPRALLKGLTSEVYLL